MPIAPGSEADRLTSALAGTFAVMCGKARAREVMRLVIEEVRKDDCQNGNHPIEHYIVAYRDVVARRDRQDEMIALVAAMRLYIGES